MIVREFRVFLESILMTSFGSNNGVVILGLSSQSLEPSAPVERIRNLYVVAGPKSETNADVFCGAKGVFETAKNSEQGLPMQNSTS